MGSACTAAAVSQRLQSAKQKASRCLWALSPHGLGLQVGCVVRFRAQGGGVRGMVCGFIPQNGAAFSHAQP